MTFTTASGDCARYSLEFFEGNVELHPIPDGPYEVIILTEVTLKA